MKPTNTVESKCLAKTDALIEELLDREKANRTELRFQLLEATASRIGGFNLEAFQALFNITPFKEIDQLLDCAKLIVESLDDTGIHPVLGLSALARETLDNASRRTNGAYHTDFRLAVHLARTVEDKLEQNMKVIDPACGAGILLVAVSIAACGSDRILANKWLRDSVYAADLSSLALRGTLLSLAALTSDLDALREMRGKWKVHDSLIAPDETWSSMAPDGFDLVIANPPWEKVKISRHEYIKANGNERDYGTSYSKTALSGYKTAKIEKSRLAAKLVERYPTLANGEPDLYVAFTELLLKLTRSGGSGALLVPAGLIRSLGTEHLRSELIKNSDELTFTIMDNRARHFSIDTRFKFLFLKYIKSSKPSCKSKAIKLAHAIADDNEVIASRPVKLPLSSLRKLRPDLTLPEVRTSAEWRLFKKMQSTGVSPKDTSSVWHPKFCREVDMTHGRVHFSKTSGPDFVPVIEGRMVQPHRLGCKTYLSGEGRSAKWQNLPAGQSKISPQFWMPVDSTSEQTQVRMKAKRVGFCDITGQTNERSMMAALIPPGVVCGNKVPTVMFPNDPSEDRLFLWLSIVNSIPFDWLLRRVVTTTVNYFVLLSVQLPKLDIKSLPAKRLIEIGRQLSVADRNGNTTFDSCWRIAMLRVEADILVANAYGCTTAELKIMLEDFPLLDRCQPALPGEDRSTVTADLLLSEWGKKKNMPNTRAAERIEAFNDSGAIAYLSSEFSGCMVELQEAAHER